MWLTTGGGFLRFLRFPPPIKLTGCDFHVIILPIMGVFNWLINIFYSILFYSILFYSILFYFILFYYKFWPFCSQRVYLLRPIIIKAPAAKAPKAAMMQNPNEKWNLDESKPSIVPNTITPTVANPPAKTK